MNTFKVLYYTVSVAGFIYGVYLFGKAMGIREAMRLLDEDEL